MDFMEGEIIATQPHVSSFERMFQGKNFGLLVEE
jgi:hypothetical protein